MATIDVGQLMTSHMALSSTFIGSSKEVRDAVVFQITFRHIAKGGNRWVGGVKVVKGGAVCVIWSTSRCKCNFSISICQTRTARMLHSLRFSTLCYSIAWKKEKKNAATPHCFSTPYTLTTALSLSLSFLLFVKALKTHA